MLSAVEESWQTALACSVAPWLRDMAPVDTLSALLDTVSADWLIWRSIFCRELWMARMDRSMAAKSPAYVRLIVSRKSPSAILPRWWDTSCATSLRRRTVVSSALVSLAVSSLDVTVGVGVCKSPSASFSSRVTQD